MQKEMETHQWWEINHFSPQQIKKTKSKITAYLNNIMNKIVLIITKKDIS